MTKKNIRKTTFSQLKKELDKSNLDWEYGDTPILHMSGEEQGRRLGLNIPAGEMKRVKSLIPAKEKISSSVDETCDWCAKDGNNWITDIRDQGNCGSYVSFATVAVLEAQGRYQFGRPDLDINLSEADLFFCGAGRKCGQGWWPTDALDFVKARGVGEESYFPYQDHDMDCKRGSESPQRIMKIGSYKDLLTKTERQKWLSTNGPLIACMAVYPDFFAYKSGIYSHKVGDLAGYHAICCIGYNNIEKYWICKNSWGLEWGDEGFFKIGFGEALIDTDFAMYGVSGISGFEPEEEVDDTGKDIATQIVIDRETVTGRNILWMNAGGTWRYMIITDQQTGALSPSIFSAKNVIVYYQKKKIIRYEAWK